MKKITAVILSVFMLLSLSGCFGYHRIRISEGDEDLVKCPRFAKAGDVVEIETVTVTDADLYVNISGVEVECVSEGLYRFVMPDQDVEINITIISNGGA
ncbi:MAG: hypothetical protein IKS51_08085 [Erysipelotrichaceae bacterium]|nr:hypothetical protein [Erysipelotrichaceae bacterium]